MGAPARPVTALPRALTIAGSDSGGGAGIQADLKTFLVLGCHGMSALTALTAQNTVGVTAVHTVPSEFVSAQIDAVATDIGVDAAKTGMLATGEIVEAVADGITSHGINRLVVDPVFVSKSRDELLAPDAVDALRFRLIPLAAVITPNLYEAAGLLGEEWNPNSAPGEMESQFRPRRSRAEDISSLAEMHDAARALHALGAGAVLVKGGHLPGDRAIDVYYDGGEIVDIDGIRYDTDDTHGTGCALSAAIAARLAHGDDALAAVRFAKEFVAGAIERGLRIGKGFGPVNPGWRNAPE